jgi:hypothetical protein
VQTSFSLRSTCFKNIPKNAKLSKAPLSVEVPVRVCVQINARVGTRVGIGAQLTNSAANPEFKLSIITTRRGCFKYCHRFYTLQLSSPGWPLLSSSIRPISLPFVSTSTAIIYFLFFLALAERHTGKSCERVFSYSNNATILSLQSSSILQLIRTSINLYNMFI